VSGKQKEMEFQVEYSCAFSRAQVFTASMNDPAKEGTVSQYDNTMEQLHELHEAMFPLIKLRKKVYAALDVDPEASGSKKGKGKGKGKETAASQEEEGYEPEEVGGNEEVIKYTERSLKHLRRLDKKLRNRLEVLYLALKFNWTRGRQAERLQRAGKSSTVYDKILKEEEEDRKRKREKEDESPFKRKNYGAGPKQGFRGRGGYGGNSQGPRNSGQSNWNMLSVMATNMAAAMASNMMGQGTGSSAAGLQMAAPARFNPMGGLTAASPGFSRRSSSFTTPDGVRKCFICQEPGHIASFCPNAKK